MKSIQSLYTTWKVGRLVQQLECNHRIWITGVHKSGVLWYMPSFSLHGFSHVTTLEPQQYWKWIEEDQLLRGNNHSTIIIGNSYLVTNLQVHPITFEIKLHIIIE